MRSGDFLFLLRATHYRNGVRKAKGLKVKGNKRCSQKNPEESADPEGVGSSLPTPFPTLAPPQDRPQRRGFLGHGGN